MSRTYCLELIDLKCGFRETIMVFDPAVTSPSNALREARTQADLFGMSRCGKTVWEKGDAQMRLEVTLSRPDRISFDPDYWHGALNQ